MIIFSSLKKQAITRVESPHSNSLFTALFQLVLDPLLQQELRPIAAPFQVKQPPFSKSSHCVHSSLLHYPQSLRTMDNGVQLQLPTCTLVQKAETGDRKSDIHSCHEFRPPLPPQQLPPAGIQLQEGWAWCRLLAGRINTPYLLDY